MRIWHQSFTVLEDVPAYTARVRAHVDRKRASMAAHTSQLPERVLDEVVPHASFAAVYGYEWYVRDGPPGPIDRLR